MDGIAGAALSVMSQGELHSLALSLFLPRATLAESPFRLVVIDDPVQSMDPARVDGLARALDETARTRQVIVFTHDDRLSEAVRRLAIKSTILSVTRRPQSVVEVRRALDPVQAHIKERGSDVMSRLNKIGPWAGDVFKQCKDGAHVEVSGDLKEMIRNTERLAQSLQELR